MSKYSEYEDEFDDLEEDEDLVPFWEKAEEEVIEIDTWDSLDDVGDYDRLED